MNNIILNNIYWMNDHLVQYRHYLINDNGEVWNLKKNKFKKGRDFKNGYKIHWLEGENKYIKISNYELARLIFNDVSHINLKDNSQMMSIKTPKIKPIYLLPKFKVGDIVYFKHYKIAGEPIRHPYIVVKISIDAYKGNKYSLISLTSNIGATLKIIPSKVKKLRETIIVIHPNETKGLTKNSIVRLTPENVVTSVPENELSFGGCVYNKGKITRAKNIFNQVLKKTAKPWTQIDKKPLETII